MRLVPEITDAGSVLDMPKKTIHPLNNEYFEGMLILDFIKSNFMIFAFAPTKCFYGLGF